MKFKYQLMLLLQNVTQVKQALPVITQHWFEYDPEKSTPKQEGEGLGLFPGLLKS